MDDLSRQESMRQNEPYRAPGVKNLDLSQQESMRDMPNGVLARIDQYELILELGGGGFGTVYLAKDTVSGVEYAVKGLPPEVKNNREELENIRENFALVSRLSHTNIARAYVLHRAKEVQYNDASVREKLRVMPGETLMVMEYAPGVTLSKWRKQYPGNRVPFPQALEITRQIAAALDYAHEQRIIHRDIKPSNVMVETKKDGRLVARVLDFGLAAEIRSSMGRVSREVRDTSGTRPYMAPEQWLGEKQTAATDQYALAVLFYELLTGEVPFASTFDTGDSVLMERAVTTRPPAIPSALPKPVRAALAKALAKTPAERFTNCGAFASALTRRTKGGVKTALAVVFLAALAVGGFLLWQRRTESQTEPVPPATDPVPPAAATAERKRERPSRLEAERKTAPAVRRTQRQAITDNGHKGIQLWEGGSYWAETNIGADKPEEYGLYFWWGDTEGHRPSGERFSFNFNSTYTFGKGKSDLQSAGWMTSAGVLAPEHDAAHVQWGGGWRMPTDQELEDLHQKCDWTWTTKNGVNGYVVRGKGGYASNSIFLPCAGYGYGTSLRNAGSYGFYWSSVPLSDYSYFSWYLYFYSGDHCMRSYFYRYFGQSVRPVQGSAN